MTGFQSDTEVADAFLSNRGLKFRAVFVERGFHFPDDKEARDIYNLTISAKGRGRVTSRFGQSLAATAKGEEPTAYDYLACLTKSDPGSFADFCSEFGYDEDSIKALATYKAVKKEWNKVERFFTADELEALQEIA